MLLEPVVTKSASEPLLQAISQCVRPAGEGSGSCGASCFGPRARNSPQAGWAASSTGKARRQRWGAPSGRSGAERSTRSAARGLRPAAAGLAGSAARTAEGICINEVHRRQAMALWIAQGIDAEGRDAARRPGSYVDGPLLATVGLGHAIGSLALICPAFFRVLRPLAKMGFADSEVLTRERHFLPVNRAECLTYPARADHTTSSFLASSGFSVRPPGLPPNSSIRSCRRGHCFRRSDGDGPIALPTYHQFPGDPRQLIGERDRYELGRLSRYHCFQPRPISAAASTHVSDDGCCPATRTDRNMPSPARVIAPRRFFPAVE